MKNKFIIALMICISIINQSCLSYAIKEKIDEKKLSINPGDYKLKYFIKSDLEPAVKVKKVESLKNVLIKYNYEEYDGNDIFKPKGTVLKIDVKQTYLQRGAAIEFLTGLTLGLIPTYSSNIAIYDYNYELYNHLKLVRKKTYTLQVNSFNWLFSWPFACGPYGDKYREQKAIDLMTRDFFSGVDLKKLH